MKMAERAFKDVLEQINVEIRGELCDFVRSDDREFVYMWDGILECSVMFHPSGTVTEVIEEHSTCYGSAFEWAQNIIDEMRNEDALEAAHEEEAKRKRAKFFNFGWGTTDNSIASKTSKGILQSDYNPQTKKITHTWETQS